MTKQYQDRGQGARRKRPTLNDQRSTLKAEDGIVGIRRSGPDRDITLPAEDAVFSDAWIPNGTLNTEHEQTSTEGRTA